MDKEILCIYEILSSCSEGITTAQISKEIYEKHGIKVSRKIVQNYLWSYFRTFIEYDPSNYTYKLNTDRFLFDGIELSEVDNPVRPISAEFKGSKIVVNYDSDLSIERLVKAISLVNFRNRSEKKQIDLIKHINRTIDLIDNNEY